MYEKHVPPKNDSTEMGIRKVRDSVKSLNTDARILSSESNVEYNAELDTESDVSDDGVGENQTVHKNNGNKIIILKNLAVITLSFLCLFTAYSSLEVLQSSLNVAGGLGLIGLTVVYTFMLLSSLFLPSFLFSKLGMKWTIVVAMFGYIAFISASFYATWGTIIPASILLGIGASNLWTGLLSYLSALSQQYSALTGLKQRDVLSKFFSVFYTVFYTGDVWGNLASSLVFSYKSSENKREFNFTCGIAFCPQQASNNSNLLVTDPVKIYVFSGFCLGCGILAVAIMALATDNIQSSKPVSGSSRKLLTAVIRQFRTSSYQKLLIQHYTEAFTSCYLGVENVGYVMICNALFCSVGSFLFGKILRWTDFRVPFIIAFILHGGTGITLLVWTPNAGQKHIFYVCTALWALGFSVYSSVLAPLYSHVFQEKTTPAMSCFNLLQSFGAVLSYGLSSFLCTFVKLSIVLCALFISTVCVIPLILHNKQCNAKQSVSK